MEDLETGEISLIDTSDTTDQKKTFIERRQQLKKLSNRAKIGLVEVNTEKPYMTTLYRFFKRRELKS